MASVEKEMMDEYIEKGEKEKDYNLSLKEKKEMKLFPKGTKMSSEEKETYDNQMRMDKKSKNNNELVDNMITNDSTKEDSKDNKTKKNQGSNPTEASTGLLQMNEKVLEGGKVPTKRSVHQRNAEIGTKRRNGSQTYIWKKWLMIMANILF